MNNKIVLVAYDTMCDEVWEVYKDRESLIAYFEEMAKRDNCKLEISETLITLIYERDNKRSLRVFHISAHEIVEK